MAKKKSLFWADQITGIIKKRVEENKTLKDTVKRVGRWVINDSKTPSGRIHIGSGRGWIIHDVIAKAMREEGLNAVFTLGNDDMDPFNKIPRYLDKEKYKKYLGMPLKDLPSHEKGYKSYADYFFMECVEKFDEFGIKAETYKMSNLYKAGKMNNVIKQALNNSQKIQEIYKEIYGKSVGMEKLPINPVCEKCGKIATTLAYEWNKEKEVIKYKCSEKLVKWAKGCGNASEMSPYNGNAKLPWKVEWAARWPVLGVLCELAGKDHYTVGGSRDVSRVICERVFNYLEPYGYAYEWFLVGGRKMSTSKGVGAGFSEMANYAPAKLLKYLLVRTRPRAVVDFDPTDPNTITLLYEEYDKTERVYFGKEKPKNPKEAQQLKRIYELSYVGQIPKKIPIQVSLRFAAIIAQIAKSDEEVINMLKRTGHIKKELTKQGKKLLLERIHYIKRWVKNFKPEMYFIEMQKEIPKIPEDIKKVIKKLGKDLISKKWTEEKLYAHFYNLCKENNVNTKDFFKYTYKVLIGKERGPRLTHLIFAFGLKEVGEKLGKIK